MSFFGRLSSGLYGNSLEMLLNMQTSAKGRSDMLTVTHDTLSSSSPGGDGARPDLDDASKFSYVRLANKVNEGRQEDAKSTCLGSNPVGTVFFLAGATPSPSPSEGVEDNLSYVRRGARLVGGIGTYFLPSRVSCAIFDEGVFAAGDGGIIFMGVVFAFAFGVAGGNLHCTSARIVERIDGHALLPPFARRGLDRRRRRDQGLGVPAPGHRR